MSMYKISKMKKEDIPELIEIWHNQYSKYCNGAVIPDFLNGGKNSIMNLSVQTLLQMYFGENTLNPLYFL